MAAAQRALTAGLSHPEPLGALVRSRETGVMPEERELLEQSEALLAHLREECPGFVFSNKIVALSERVRLENDLGRRLDDRQSGSFLNLVVKDEASPNVFDTGIGWTSRGNAAIDGWRPRAVPCVPTATRCLCRRKSSPCCLRAAS